MTQKTALYESHLAHDAKIVDFHGWLLPIHYGSQMEEHHQVRKDAGMFDVSHMTTIDIEGSDTRKFLHKLLANNVDRLKESGKALYSCMLNERGGIIDDLIVYYLNDNWYRMVINAATRERGLSWMKQQAASLDVAFKIRDDLSMIAIQGPNARDKTHKTLSEHSATLEQIKPFNSAMIGDLFVARTGYTGEDGYEVMVPDHQAAELWQQLYSHGVQPIGLGARDTLRLESGFNLSGTDMDETISPFECDLVWTIAWDPKDRDFIGRAVLEGQLKMPPPLKQVGLVLNEKGVLRNGQKLITDNGGEGIITSGGFSPTLGRAIALARVPLDISDTCKVEIRSKLLTATIVKPPFVRQGKSCITEMVKGITV
jgi:aminomethyltransferase